ncbi:hypothetical protein M3Y98_00629200 [Aphelenchoides besseyi]|nr:hypothetical protein M3Y98_00629200 [Aphelenchoides besseyi]KAI6208459.1 hypothetical protein M3Y96_00117500 [Aphelenchoides besseyi]
MVSNSRICRRSQRLDARKSNETESNDEESKLDDQLELAVELEEEDLSPPPLIQFQEIFKAPQLSKSLSRKRSHSDDNLPPQLQPLTVLPSKRNRSLQIPQLERMDKKDEDQPPALTPITKTLGQRDRPPKFLPVLQPISSSKTELDAKDLLIQRLTQTLRQRAIELSLVQRQLKVTQELLQFYQETRRDDLFPASDEMHFNSSDGRTIISDMLNSSTGAQATAFPVECNQEILNLHLSNVTSNQEFGS